MLQSVNQTEAAPLHIPMPTNGILKVIGMVSKATGISTEDICSPKRTDPLVRARQIVMYLCREKQKHSLPRIGRRLGNRDHTTVLHGVRQIASKRQLDANLNDLLNALESELAA